MKASKEAVFERTGQVFRMATRWLVSDLLYAILPLIVIATLTDLLGRGFKDFLLLKEWSFASIVLYGTAIRKTIKLKTQIQRIPRSETLDLSVQGVIPLLVGSVLVLAVVVLMEFGILPKGATRPVAVAQLMFFLMASVLILVLLWAEELALERTNSLPTDLPKGWVMKRVNYDLEDVSRGLLYVVWAFEKLHDHAYTADSDPGWGRLLEHERVNELENCVSQIERLTQTMRQKFESLRLSGPGTTPETGRIADGAQ